MKKHVATSYEILGKKFFNNYFKQYEFLKVLKIAEVDVTFYLYKLQHEIIEDTDTNRKFGSINNQYSLNKLKAYFMFNEIVANILSLIA